MSANEDVRNVNRIVNKVSFTPSVTAVELMDDIADLAQKYPNDHTFGTIMRAVVHNIHTNLKS